MQNPGKTRVGSLCLRHETWGKRGFHSGVTVVGRKREGLVSYLHR